MNRVPSLEIATDVPNRSSEPSPTKANNSFDIHESDDCLYLKVYTRPVLLLSRLYLGAPTITCSSLLTATEDPNPSSGIAKSTSPRKVEPISFQVC